MSKNDYNKKKLNFKEAMRLTLTRLIDDKQYSDAIDYARDMSVESWENGLKAGQLRAEKVS
ncbi:MAG: hypothetical protein K0U93_15500 [Gammaproteobacteria bacterium]|nr:hypothetical protein [Gammaproteobacteria bacterium]